MQQAVGTSAMIVGIRSVLTCLRKRRLGMIATTLLLRIVKIFATKKIGSITNIVSFLVGKAAAATMDLIANYHHRRHLEVIIACLSKKVPRQSSSTLVTVRNHGNQVLCTYLNVHHLREAGLGYFTYLVGPIRGIGLATSTV